MFINLSVLKRNKNFRFLFAGQTISHLGSMISYVAIQYQIYALTKSNLLVGYVSLVQLAAILLFGIAGGGIADRINRKKMMLTCEFIMMLVTILFVINSMQAQPSIIAIFVLAGVLQSANSFHRPAMDALNQSVVDKSDYKSVATLSTFRFSIASIAGPAIAGILISYTGFHFVYLLNTFSFLVSLSCLYSVKKIGRISENNAKSLFSDVSEGLKYALKKPELLGSYLIDIVAMVFAFPVALYPALSEKWGGAHAAGILYSSMAIGAFFISVFSKWTERVVSHGKAIILSALIWAVCICLLGLTSSFYTAILCLIFAGAADAVSGIFRSTLWNEVIPNQMRGRMSAIEMISYMSGPLLGNARAGAMASAYSVTQSILIGGLICIVAIIITAILFKRLWIYKSNLQQQT